LGAVAIWLIASVLSAALLAPWLCRGGYMLAEMSETRQLPGLVQWVAESSGRAKLTRYFDRSLLLAALVYLPFLIKRIRRLRAEDTSRTTPHEHRPDLRTGAWQLCAGFLMASAFLAGLCLALAMSGVYQARPDVAGTGRFISKVIVPAIFAASLEEWLFRGLLYGIWLRFVTPWAAVLGTALMYSLLHFTHPPGGMEPALATHPAAGFLLLGGVIGHFSDPMFFVTDFATLCLVGVLLGWARMRTGALWLGIGLHAGWILVIKACSFFYVQAPDHYLREWWIGGSLRSGMLPLLTLGLTGWMCVLWLRMHTARRQSTAQQADADH